jgi:hypothetical protein
MSCLTALKVIGGITSFPSFCDMKPVPHNIAVRSNIKLPFVLSLMTDILQRKPLDFKPLTLYTNRACALGSTGAASRGRSDDRQPKHYNLLLVMPKQKGAGLSQ